MSKYDFELDLDSENSVSLIIDMIKPNSKILEFGPANGRLTKYLKEDMNCVIDIVEIDEEAGKEASKYANKSFIGERFGNIEKYIWLDDLKNEKYDYIVFADVLEHLYWPDKVLRKCKKVLKDEGSILISIPNIAHNSIIIDLINDEFRYNNIGLLDNTHIRFFTYNSIIRMLNEVGLVSTIEKATYGKVGETEIDNLYESIDRDISKGLRNRKRGNIYQFVFEVKKREYYFLETPLRAKNLDRYSGYETVLYLNEENQENTEDKTIRKNIFPGYRNQKINFKGYGKFYNIRLDPISSNCIISDLSIIGINDTDKIELDIKYTNAELIYDNKYFFSTNDPQIYIDSNGYQEIELEFNIIEYDSDNIDFIIYIVRELIIRKNKEIEDKEKEIKDKEKEIKDKEKEIKDINNTLSITKDILSIKEKYIKEIENSRGWKILTKVKRILGK